jgi:hypothetical protein
MRKFSRKEIKNNLLGSLEVALLIPGAEKRFGDTPDEAIRSFLVPILLFPLSMVGIFLFPTPAMEGHSQNMITILYSLRFAISWALFFGCIYWLAGQYDRKERFCKFVIASNWISVPAIAICLPVLGLVLSGRYSADELYPFTVCLMLYTYVFTAFMAGRVLRLPWEMGAFIAIIGMATDNCVGNMINLFSSVL